MIATSGDEAFVMLSMFPLQALWLSVIFFIVAIAAGLITDMLFKKTAQKILINECHELEVHQTDICQCYSPRDVLPQLRNISFPRAVLIALLGDFLFALLTGMLGSDAWDWKKLPLL